MNLLENVQLIWFEFEKKTFQKRIDDSTYKNKICE